MKLKRQDVYKLLDGERDYQDNLPSNRTDGREKTVGDWLTLLDRYVRKAQDSYADTSGDDAALNEIRKVGGLVVHCLEHYGANPR